MLNKALVVSVCLACAGVLAQAAEITPPPYVEGDILTFASGQSFLGVTGFGKSSESYEWKGKKWSLLPIPLGTKPGPHAVQMNHDSGPTWVTLAVEILPPVLISLSVPTMTKKTVAALSQENKILKDVYADFIPEPLWKGAFQIPCDGRLTAGFGEGRVYNKKVASWRHTGVDYGLKKGGSTDICAPQAGKVASVENFEAHGGTVVINHGCGLFTVYLHLKSAKVKVGEKVKAGQVIGEMGATGIATGTHLHWGAKLHGTTVNPLSLLKLSL